MGDKKGFVYLIGDSNNDGVFKIGVTRGAIENRMKKLQTGNPGKIHLFAYHESRHPFFIEKRLHLLLGQYRENNEWFRLPLDIQIGFNKMCDEQETVAESIKNNPFVNLK